MFQLRRIIRKRSQIFKSSTILEIQVDSLSQISDVISLKHEEIQHFVGILHYSLTRRVFLIEILILAS